MKKILDISIVPVENVLFVWLSRICESNKIDVIIISKEQSNDIFSSGLGKWTHYRDIVLKIKK